MKRFGIKFQPIILFLVVLSVAEIAIRWSRLPSYLLPPPSEIILTFIDQIRVLLRHATVTASEAALGFLVANLFGFLLSIAFAHSILLKRSLYPYVIILKVMPIVAVAPLFVLWFGNGLWSKVAIAALIAFPPIVVNGTRGLQSVESSLLDLFKVFGANWWQVLTKLRLPTALPHLLSALKISAPLATVGAIVGELVGSNYGLGYLLLIDSYQLNTARMFAVVAVAAGIGLVFYAGLTRLEQQLLFWRQEGDDNA